MKKKRLNLIKLAAQRIKASRGFSLVTVVVLGGVVMLWMYAASQTILTTYWAASAFRFHTVIRNGLESGVDYVISQLNSGIANGVSTSTWDNSSWQSVPSSIIGSNVPVVVSVSNQAAPTTSLLYDAAKDPTQTSQISTNGWRVVTAIQDPNQTPYAGIDTNRQIQVILEPLYGTAVQTPQNVSQQVPYFTNAIFAQSAIYLSGFSIDGYNSAAGPWNSKTNYNTLAGNVGTYGTPNPPTITSGYFTWNNYPLYLDSAAIVGGNAAVIGTTSTQTVAAAQSTSSQVYGQLSLDGVYQNEKQVAGVYTGNFVATPGPTPGHSDSVGTGVTSPRSATTGTTTFEPILTGQANNVAVPNTLFSAPGSTSTYSSSAPSVLTSAQSTPSGATALGNKLGTLSSPLTSTYSLAPGDYSANSITLSGNGSIQLSADSSGNVGPVRIFINSSSQSPVISMTGNAQVNSSSSAVPANLQIWYNGTSPIYLHSSTNFTGLIYAPNSAIRLGGSATVSGALVGYTVQAKGTGKIHFDSSLNNPASKYNLTFPVNLTVTGPVQPLTGFKATTWIEQ